MNFYSHAVIAEREEAHPGFVFGAMLPDFSGMAKARVRDVPDHVTARGVACHHAVDAAFHGSDAFIACCAESVVRLTAEGLPRGPARAVAHVGLELVLDSFLVRTYGPSSMYLDALHEGVRQLDAGLLVPDDAGRAPALAHMLARLVAHGPPSADTDDLEVTARLVRMLAGRARLAIPSDGERAVTREVARMRASMRTVGPRLVAAAEGRGA